MRAAELIMSSPQRTVLTMRTRNLSTYLGLISFSMFATYAPEHLLNLALGLLFYDYLLTLGWEITRYWGSVCVHTLTQDPAKNREFLTTHRVASSHSRSPLRSSTLTAT